MSISAGVLKHRITILRPVRSISELGAERISYPPAYDVYAKIEGNQGTEIYAGEQLQAISRYMITIRDNFAIKTDWRVKYRDEIYEIEGLARNFNGELTLYVKMASYEQN